MFTRILHSLVARPRVYNALQAVVGGARERRRLAEHLSTIPGGAVVLDVGGGTGLSEPLVPGSARYVCLDLDPAKLRGFRARRPGGLAVAADAGSLPVADASVDAVMLVNVSHHLSDALLMRFLGEAARVLKPSGVLVLADAVWKPCRLPSRVLWHYDRGAHPRSADALRKAVGDVLRIRSCQRVRVLHEYVVCLAGR